ncbi:ZIP family metal transporter [Halorhabdus sp. CBA1104]|uniref:ZIP family metal transporter n=1 Tax=Halorhabdus sp. CBA1104 TaxID=1380432 RepID=UPI0012B34C73|nr:ZIP family metal transporter [Halorhabdus sp. CBA1104]QGN06738.1 ZIP family metal transporter [Halorhabdus sp. CBA1104]
MTPTKTEEPRRDRIAKVVSAVTAILFVSVLAAGIVTERTTLVVVVVFGFLAMAAGVTISLFVDFSTPNRQVWAYGLASGAMLASAAALLAPKAIGRHPEYGGFAIALGYLLGYAGHELGHLVSHYDLPLNAAVSELTLHALAAGSIMGVVYGSLPDLSALFGFGILAHKFPAGFTGSEALRQSGIPRTVMIVPAAAVALAAIPLSILTPDLSATVQAVFYGVSTGVFAHVAIDMLPECSHVGSHADSSGHGTIECSRNIHRVRQYAVASTLAGAGAIFVLWQALAMG